MAEELWRFARETGFDEGFFEEFVADICDEVAQTAMELLSEETGSELAGSELLMTEQTEDGLTAEDSAEPIIAVDGTFFVPQEANVTAVAPATSTQDNADG